MYIYTQNILNIMYYHTHHTHTYMRFIWFTAHSMGDVAWPSLKH